MQASNKIATMHERSIQFQETQTAPDFKHEQPAAKCQRDGFTFLGYRQAKVYTIASSRAMTIYIARALRSKKHCKAQTAPDRFGYQSVNVQPAMKC